MWKMLLDILEVQEASTVPLVCEIASELQLLQALVLSILTSPSEAGGCRKRFMQEELPLLTSLIECTSELELLLEASCTFNLSNPITSRAVTSIGVSSYPISLGSNLELDFKTSSKDNLDFGILP